MVRAELVFAEDATHDGEEEEVEETTTTTTAVRRDACSVTTTTTTTTNKKVRRVLARKAPLSKRGICGGILVAVRRKGRPFKVPDEKHKSSKAVSHFATVVFTTSAASAAIAS